MELTDVATIVTGGGRGIGKALAERFATEGARVIITARSQDELEETARDIQEQGGTARPMPADVTNWEEVRRVARRAEEEFGPVNVLINNAGSLSAVGPTWEVDHRGWLRDITVNLYGTMLCCRVLMPGMIERGAGYVLNMVGGGTTGPHLYGSGYGCSKAGLMAFTETLAREAEGTGVKVFAMDPGLVRTDMTEALVEGEAGRKWRPGIGEMFQKGRDNPPELVAELAVKLVSGRADALTGRYFHAGEDFKRIIDNADRIVEKDARVLRLLRL